uniref:Uncharacterized protein n=1 Tax=Vespula pensylvanica TaxID=30213 RepID=A0A834NSS6_VESPE|nr:hypothetical protein H0235_011872 [Vespula pensylvanica]
MEATLALPIETNLNFTFIYKLLKRDRGIRSPRHRRQALCTILSAINSMLFRDRANRVEVEGIDLIGAFHSPNGEGKCHSIELRTPSGISLGASPVHRTAYSSR